MWNSRRAPRARSRRSHTRHRTVSVRTPEPQRPRVLGGLLTGGMGRRMDGLDKGLVPLNGKPLAQHVIERLAPQVDALLVNANRNQDRYQTFGYAVVADHFTGFQGPLAGMEALLRAASSSFSDTECIDSGNRHHDTAPEPANPGASAAGAGSGAASGHTRRHTLREVAGIVTAPCDAPYLPEDLVARLTAHFSEHGIDRGAVASVGGRLQPVFAYLPVSALADLQAALEAGERKIDRWFAHEKFLEINFPDSAQFSNLNTPEDLATQTQVVTHTRFGAPVIGISAPSGTGKTTFLTGLLPRLKAAGLTVGVIKRAHHNVEIDKPGKDSFEIRHAGADRVLLAAHTRWALMVETPHATPANPAELVARIESPELDLVLIEGFDLEGVNRVVLAREGTQGAADTKDYRGGTNGAGSILARFSDRPNVESSKPNMPQPSAAARSRAGAFESAAVDTSVLPQLDLNNLAQAAEFFIEYAKTFRI